jgi:DNA polymerase I-like protein with 3'-5' exonuclease and polymerase domains
MANLKPIIPSEMNPPLNGTKITSPGQFPLVADFISRVDSYVFDVETNCSDDLFERKIRTIQLGDRNEQYTIDLLEIAGSTAALISSQGNYGAAAELVFGELIALLRPSLESNKWLKTGTNLQFDYEMMFWNLGVRAWNFFDNFLAEKVIYAGEKHFMATGFWAMEDLVARYCGLKMDEEETGKTFDLETPLTEVQWTYTFLDARLPLSVRGAQLVKLEREKLLTTAQIEFDAIPAFGDMHLFGFKLDTQAWINLFHTTMKKQELLVAAMDDIFIPVVGTKYITEADKEKLSALEEKWRNHPDKTLDEKSGRKTYRIAFMAKRKEINDRTKEANKCEGEAALNYSSGAQLHKALLKLGYKKKDLPDTKDDTLKPLAEYRAEDWDINKAIKQDPTLKSFKAIDLIRLYRSTDKALGTYGQAWVETQKFVDRKGKTKSGLLNPFSKRIHSNIIQLGAATGRTSSNKPNIQNIPRESDYRFCFISGPGHKLVTVDMSGAELRILAELSKEPVWVEAFKNGWDVHSVGAEIVFGKKWADGTEDGCKFAATKHKCKCSVHKELRQIAKTINFMLAYGGGPQKLADEVGITFEEADHIINDLYKPAFPTVTKFLETLGDSACNNLEARTMCGRRRKWPRPSWESAKEKVKEDCEEGESPTQHQIRWKLRNMNGAIRREGMNCPIQGANADFMKRAMGCGFDPNGKPYLWHILWPTYKAMMVSMVHDELVTEAPDAVAEEVKSVVGDAMTRASAEWMKVVVMETEGAIDIKWAK